MGYPMPNASFVEATLRYEIAGQTCLNIGHWRWDYDSDSGDGPTLLDYLATVLNDPDEGLAALLSAATTSDVTIRELVLQLIRPTRWARRVYPATPSVGTGDPPSTPPNWVCTSTKRSDSAGPHAHSSLFTSGFPAEAIASNRIAAAAVTAIDLYAAIWGQVIPGPTGLGEFVPVIYNRTTPSSSQQITSISTGNEPRAQRRRQLRLGI